MRPALSPTRVHRVKPALSPRGLRAAVVLSLVSILVFWLPLGALLWWLFS